MIGYILLVLAAGAAYLGLLRYYATLWDATPEIGVASSNKQKVSVLIPFRNEKENLPRLVASIEEQEIGSLDVEIVFVNDHSTDAGELLIANYTGILSTRLVALENGEGKKAAIKKGWEHCQGDFIIQTDADCVLPPNWLTVMLASFTDDQVLLACGPVRFNNPTNFWQRIVALDFAGLIAIGAAHIQWGNPMICNAANLAYRKSLIADAALKEGVTSGDDVFLLQSAHHKNPEGIVFVKNKWAIVQTEGPSSFSAFWNQRLRWASKNGEYDIVANTGILLGVWIYNILILVSVLSVTSVGATAAAFLFILKVLAEDHFYSKFTDFFSIKRGFTNILLGQPFHIIYMAVVPPLSQVLKYKWKERKVSK
jgi:cellulose synthase/poly-beta-1,6-N-acetylglucosamine synthase-like glycosyltransferase